MRRIRRILVAVKVPAAKVLPARAKAAQLARAFDAELVLFQAIATRSISKPRSRGYRPIAIERRARDACPGRLEVRVRRLPKPQQDRERLRRVG